MPHLEIGKSKEIELKKQMMKLNIFEKDIKEQFTHSSGPGGQNVNNVETCVVMEHIPTGIQVKCQDERSQSHNRKKARRLLLDKVIKYYNSKEAELEQSREKIKRQNRKRPLGLKEKVLHDKHYKSDKKVTRRKIDSVGEDDL